MQAALSLRQIHWRAELRLALLAAAEACWIYVVVLTLGAIMGAPHVISPVGIFFVYWVALQTGRLLPRSQQTWRLLQIATIVIAVIAIVIAMRIGLYETTPLTDFSWLPNYFGRTFTFFERMSAEALSTFALVFTFLRGMSFAQRPLTLWVVGFQFRLGIIIFFGAAFVSALSVPVNFIVWVFAYFAFSLPAIALARIEEAGQEGPLGGRWALVMFTAIGATMLLGFFAVQFFTLDTINALFELFSPLGFIVQILITLIAIPIFFILELAGNLLAPFFNTLRDFLAGMRLNLNGNNPEIQRVLNDVTRVIVDLAPYIRLVSVVLVVVLIGWLIARALNKRMNWQEREMFAREAVDDTDGFAPETRPRARPLRFARRELHAENVRRIYAALLAQAEGAGLKRRDAETPLEFLPRLSARFPDLAPALQQITDAYVAVHYAQQPASDAQVRELRALWQRIKPQIKPAPEKK